MNSKKDQEQVVSSPFPQSIQQLEADLERTRAQMSATIDELTHRLSPSHQIDVAKTCVKNTVNTVKDDATALVDDAKTGDRKSILILGGIAVGLTAATVFCIYKIVK